MREWAGIVGSFEPLGRLWSVAWSFECLNCSFLKVHKSMEHTFFVAAVWLLSTVRC